MFTKREKYRARALCVPVRASRGCYGRSRAAGDSTERGWPPRGSDSYGAVDGHDGAESYEKGVVRATLANDRTGANLRS